MKLEIDNHNAHQEQIKEDDSIPNVIYEEWRISAKPNMNEIVTQNPPSLLWKSEKHWKNKNATYKVYLSKDQSFSKESTLVSEEQKYCFYNPHKKLEVGKWYWKYDVISEGETVSEGIFSFTINSEALVFETPKMAEIIPRISQNHPRVMSQGKDLETIRSKAKEHPFYQKIVSKGNRVITTEIYRGPVGDPDPAVSKAISRITGKEIKNYRSVLEAYVLSGEKKMLANLLQRTQVFLEWPTDDLLGSQVLTSLATGYDVLFDDLSENMKQDMLAVIEKQFIHGLKKWPGTIETRHVENHFWQMEIAGNFIAALATLGDLKESREMLAYTYELFIARFPNLATQEGGWAEGMGYFGVNKSSIIDMPLVLKKVCGVDVFKMNWYENLANYFLYFAPVDGRIAGFGDMHDRVGNGNVGHSMMLVVGVENNDTKALYRLSALLKSKKIANERESWFEDKLESIEPWYQIVNDIHFNPDKIDEPKDMSSAKLFDGVGLSAFHTDVLHSEKNTAVYFRSSPFGAKGHMHANQNCFNLSRKGEPIFYSTGYYTTFADPHSLTSYKHTRAHNGILVDGMGQAFGHEGYGRIKQFINGERIAYVCGDATKAYQPMVDKQWIDLNLKNGIKPTKEHGFGDAELKTFERHLVFIKPSTVVIYDVLESKKDVDWSLLLHTMLPPEKDENDVLKLSTDKSNVLTSVFGSMNLKSSISNQFYSPAIDIKKKYKSIPNQYHITYNTIKKSKKMRYLSIIQMEDADKRIPELKISKDTTYTFGDIILRAELNSEKEPSISISTKKDTFYLNNPSKENFKDIPVLVEGKGSEKKTIYGEKRISRF